MRKAIGVLLGTFIITGMVFFLLFHFGLPGFGTGTGNGDENTDAVEETQTTEEESKEIEITIVVTQDKYLIDEQEVTLTQIKELVTDASAAIEVILEDNYASAKAWDDIKTNLESWGITPIVQ